MPVKKKPGSKAVRSKSKMKKTMPAKKKATKKTTKKK
jgi:hypothetical protein